MERDAADRGGIRRGLGGGVGRPRIRCGALYDGGQIALLWILSESQTIEIEFPVEFIVKGTPVSLQAKRPASRAVWKEKIKKASISALPEAHFSSIAPISVTLFYFPDCAMTGDIDNIVKPILDALCQHIYVDDKQVERVWVQKFEPGRVFQFRNPSPMLSKALAGDKPLLFIRIVTDPTEGLV